MNFETVFLPAMIVVGSELRTTWMNKECYSAIPAFWQQQKDENKIQSISNKVDSGVVFGLVWQL